MPPCLDAVQGPTCNPQGDFYFRLALATIVPHAALPSAHPAPGAVRGLQSCLGGWVPSNSPVPTLLLLGGPAQHGYGVGSSHQTVEQKPPPWDNAF